MNKIDTDQAGHEFVETHIGNNVSVRLTFIPRGWSGQPSIRIQIKEETGPPRPGPEVPLSRLWDIVGDGVSLLKDKVEYASQGDECN